MARPPDLPFSAPPLDDEDPELGPPVLELQALRAAMTPGFHRRLTRRIERRRVAADLTTLGVTGPVTAVLEVLAGLLQPARPAPRRLGPHPRTARRHVDSAPPSLVPDAPTVPQSGPQSGPQTNPDKGE